MLRPTLIYLSKAGWAKGIVTHFGPARRAARRFVAGETIDEALDTIQRLKAKGLDATFNFLGEHVHTEAEAREAAEAYCLSLDRAAAMGINATVSVKPSALGLDISETLCTDLTRAILDKAQPYSVGITIDMESSEHTEQTLRVYHRLHDDEGYKHLGVVIQAYLYRSEEDMKTLAATGGRVRLCKGAYKEPPEIAFPKKSQVDDNFAYLCRLFLNQEAVKAGAYLEVATHDERMIDAAKYHASQNGITPDQFEFQMLYGVRTGLQEQLVSEGYRVRIYVPYGSQWYPYFMRRMAENPANLWFMAANFFRR
mgnify:CR=1 FL=1